MQAIETIYQGATAFKGSRIKARTCGGSLVVPWDHALDTEANYAHAAEQLCEKMGWRFNHINGFTVNGMVFVQLPE